MTNEVLKAIENRRSCKAFRPEQIKPEELDAILKAGTFAPTGRNKQAPIILAVTNKEIRDQLSKINAGKDPYFRVDPFYNAPCVLVVLADKSVPTYLYDGSLVMENMLRAAHSLGLGACWIHRAKETFETEEGKALLKELGIEGDYEGIGNCVVGYANVVSTEDKPRRANRVYYVK